MVAGANYLSEYNMNLADYPLINCGRAGKNVYYPAEMVEIQPGQSAKVKLNVKETADMLTIACRTPYLNAISLTTESRGTLGHDDPVLAKFGISIGKQLLAIQARVLAAPRVIYRKRPDDAQPPSVTPYNGSWNMKNVKVVRAGRPFDRWSYVNIQFDNRRQIADPGTVSRFAQTLSNNLGVAINKQFVQPPIPQILRQDAMAGTLDRFFKEMHKNNVQLILFILSDKDSTGLYNKIKTLGDCVYGIHTSCVVLPQFMKQNDMYVANVGLKINLKAGGINHQLSGAQPEILKEGRTMIVGYDVTHPTNMNLPKGSPEPPSLVGLVASMDRHLGQWPSVSWEQSSRQEMLSDRLVQEFGRRIDIWKENNKNIPLENIVIYRDGVSEGQFSQVLDGELASIRKACAQKMPGKPPKISIIVSVKRHQTRFYPSRMEDKSDSGNVKTGTVVDRGITQVRYWDFYLTAHNALQGTARPAHYTVLLDEIFRARYKDKAANELERLTHEICYLFGRATKAVSICPPAYYADLVCERARAHRPEFNIEDDDSVVSGGAPAEHGPAQNRMVHERLQNTMYYM